MNLVLCVVLDDVHVHVCPGKFVDNAAEVTKEGLALLLHWGRWNSLSHMQQGHLGFNPLDLLCSISLYNLNLSKICS